MTDLAALSKAELADQLTTWAGRIASGEARLLALIGEFDEKQGWADIGILSCAHWLTWKLGLTPSTAREKVRVAKALRELPLVTQALSEARISYAQARAITRVATAADESQWVDLSRHTTAAQLEKATRGVRRSRREQEKQADPGKVEYENRVRVWWDEDGTLVATMRIAPCDAPAVMVALEEAQRREQADRDAGIASVAADLGASAEAPEPYYYVEPPYPQRTKKLYSLSDPPDLEYNARVEEWRERTAAMRQKARDYDAWEQRVLMEATRRQLKTGKATLGDGLVRVLTRPEAGKPVKVQLLVDPMSGWARTDRDEMLPPSTMRSLLRSLPGRQKLPKVRPVTQADLRQHDQGRRSRLVTPALRTLLGHTDGECCRFPGCTRVRKLHAHHVVFWAAGGSTDMDNLVLVCSRHHTVIHEQGFQLVLGTDRSLAIRTKEGTPVLLNPPLPWQPYEDLDEAEPLTSDWANDPFDLSHVTWVLMQHAA